MNEESIDVEAKERELAEARQKVARIEAELTTAAIGPQWEAEGYYGAYYATTGFMLGIFASMTSLLVNVIGASLVGKDSLELIRVYLTFPLGEKALGLASGLDPVYRIDDGVILAIGCCLYLATGMLLGVVFHLVMTRLTAQSSVGTRLIVGSGLALAIWLVNFYGILSWLQPMVCGGSWITDGELLPWWVAAGTHLVFGWTMVLLYPLGEYAPYRLQTEK